MTTYSNLCTQQESGDTVGLRITLDREAGQVIYEFTEGALMEPAKTTKVAFERKTNALFFRARTPSGTASFRGHATPSSLDGMFRSGLGTGTAAALRLPSVKEHRRVDQIPTCRP